VTSGVCRYCGATDRDARFHPLERTKCAQCSDRLKGERVARRAGRLQCVAVERVKRGVERINPRHLEWVRANSCVVHSALCDAVRHAHHVRLGTGGGTSLKPGDEWTVSICARHHSELHTIGQRTFETKYRTGPLREIAERLAKASPFMSGRAAA